MNFSFQQLALKKRYPLRISRGETTGSVNLFISVDSGGVVGLGEAAPDATADIGTAASCQREIEAFLEANGPVTLNPYDAWQVARDAGLSSYSWAAVDIALWDLLARQAGLPNGALAQEIQEFQEFCEKVVRPPNKAITAEHTCVKFLDFLDFLGYTAFLYISSDRWYAR